MTYPSVRIRELAGWDFDKDEYRPDVFDRDQHSRARRLVAARPPFQPESALLDTAACLHDSLVRQMSRPDLQAEMAGLNWSLGVIDLRLLLAFQRRLVMNPNAPRFSVPSADDGAALMDVSFASPKEVVCDVVRCESAVLLQSGNPNLQLRISDDTSSPITVHAGSPFFEVAQYRERWFLRDGYHRAYSLLRAGVFRLPAVIVQARTLEELGATRPWFFPEEVLFSPTPPRVTDFLDDKLVLEYDRIPLIKTLRVTVEEAFVSAVSSGEK
jgi:hypothetical protein